MSKAIEESKKLMQQLKNHVRGLEMSAFRNGVMQGLEEGLRVGRMTALHAQLTVRFGPLPPDVEQQIMNASIEHVDLWLFHFVKAQSLDQVFQPAPLSTSAATAPHVH